MEFTTSLSLQHLLLPLQQSALPLSSMKSIIQGEFRAGVSELPSKLYCSTVIVVEVHRN